MQPSLSSTKLPGRPFVSRDTFPSSRSMGISLCQIEFQRHAIPGGVEKVRGLWRTCQGLRVCPPLAVAANPTIFGRAANPSSRSTAVRPRSPVRECARRGRENTCSIRAIEQTANERFNVSEHRRVARRSSYPSRHEFARNLGLPSTLSLEIRDYALQIRERGDPKNTDPCLDAVTSSEERRWYLGPNASCRRRLRAFLEPWRSPHEDAPFVEFHKV